MALIAGGFGGDGHFGSGAIFGRLQPEFFERVWAGDYARAGEIADFYAKVMAQLRGTSDGYNWKYGGMQPTLKAVMRLQGLPAGWSRKPKIDITDSKALAEIRAVLEANGLLRREAVAAK
jgi:4-hydroxy-tetrahydrodipicolinate synthase